MNYTDITTDEKVFEALGMTPDQAPDFSKCRPKDAIALTGLYMMELAIEAINGSDFIADLANDHQCKYALYPDVEEDCDEPSGFWFLYYVCDFVSDYSIVGARRLFKNRDKAKHFWKYFKPHYVAYTIGNK